MNLYRIIFFLFGSVLLSGCIDKEQESKKYPKKTVPYYSECKETVERLKYDYENGGSVEVTITLFDRLIYPSRKIIGYLVFTLKNDENILVSNEEYLEIFLSSFFGDCTPESSRYVDTIERAQKYEGYKGIYDLEDGKLYFYYNDGNYRMPDRN